MSTINLERFEAEMLHYINKHGRDLSNDQLYDLNVMYHSLVGDQCVTMIIDEEFEQAVLRG